MCSTDSTYSSSDSSSFCKKRTRIFSLFKVNGSKMEDNFLRKFSEPNPAELLLYRKRSTPAIKLWAPESAQILRTSDDLKLNKLQKKPSIVEKFRKHKNRIGTTTSEEDELNENFYKSSNSLNLLKRSHSFRDSWNKLWNKKITKHGNKHNDSFSSTGSEKSERHRNEQQEIYMIKNNSDKNEKAFDRVKINEKKFISVLRNSNCDKLSLSENDLPATTETPKILPNGKTLEKCQDNMLIKGHTRRRSWTNYFIFG